MSSEGALPQWIDHRRSAVNGRIYEGTVGLGDLPRVRAETVSATETAPAVNVSLSFFEDSERRVRISGRIRALLTLRCQRCLQAFDTTIEPDVSGVVVADDDAAANVPRADEPIVSAGDWLNAYTLIEDELLLALPVAARCARETCQSQYASSGVATPPSEGQRKKNPFAALETLKKDH